MVYVRKMGFDTSLPVFPVFRVGSQAPTNSDQLHFWCRCCQNSASVQQRPILCGDRIWGEEKKIALLLRQAEEATEDCALRGGEEVLWSLGVDNRDTDKDQGRRKVSFFKAGV